MNQRDILLISIFIFSVILLPVIIVWSSSGDCVDSLFSGFIGSFLCAFFTFLLVIVAAIQLNKIRSTSSADFIHKLKSDFFNPDVRVVFHLVANNYILFREPQNEGDEVYFEIDIERINNSNIPGELKESLTKRKYYSVVEMNDYLLGYFEDIGIFWEQGIIDISTVYEQFDYYLSTACDNAEIRRYIDWERQDITDAYDKFDKVCAASAAYEKIKLGH